MGTTRKKREERQRSNDNVEFSDQEGLVFVSELNKHVTRAEALEYYNGPSDE